VRLAALALIFACAPPQPAPFRPEPLLSACLTKPACTWKFVVAHRGAGAGEPENTVAALLAAAANGADMVEVDTRETSDGEVVILHDSTLDRTTDATGDLSQRTFASLASVHMDDPRCAGADADPQRCTIPTFRAMLQAARGKVMVFIDFKSGDPAKAARTVHEEEMDDAALFFDSDLDKLAAARAANPALAVMPRASDAASAEALARHALKPPVVHGDPGYAAEAAPLVHAAGARLLADVFLPVDAWYLLADSGEGAEARAKGDAELRALAEAGLDLMQTDFHPYAKAALAPLNDAAVAP
jgi:glycerophosphoryl diester phosphodiesterase